MKNLNYLLIAAFSIAMTSLNGQSMDDKKVKWTKLFPKNGLGTSYEIKADNNASNAADLFEVKKNKVKVLYNWPDGMAPFATISTIKEYSHFNIEFKYKWGKRKFAPRAEEKRDAGFLFHVHGEKIVWPSSLECQVQEGDTGDLWVIKGPKVQVKLPDGGMKEVDASGESEYVSNKKYSTHENTGWNHVRVEVRGSELARFYVNGNLVNELTDFIAKDGSPLDKGLLSFQAEGAELIYKKIRIQDLRP